MPSSSSAGSLLSIAGRRAVGRLAAVAAIGLGLAGAPAGAAPLKPYTDPKKIFQVLMPTPVVPKQKTISTKVGPVVANIFLCADRLGAFVVSYNDYPPSVTRANPSRVMEGAARGAASSTGCKVSSLKPVSQNGLRGVETEYSNAQLVGRSRVYLVGRRLFQTTVIRDAKAGMDPESDTFLTSFKLTR